jgi:inner membrane protein
MIDAMWVWGAIGLILLAVEMATGTFYVLWFGVSALCVAVATWILPTMPHAMQFVLFAALAGGSLAIWKLHYKKVEIPVRVGQAQGEEIGRVGTVTAACGPSQAGKIQFTQGVLGSKEWVVIANQHIDSGTEARIIAVEGNMLRVEAI